MKRHLLAASLALACAADTGERAAEPVPQPAGEATRISTAHNLLPDVTADAQIDFTHSNGATGRKYLPEILGSGGAVLDYDGDGWFDLYLMQSGPLPWEPRGTTRGNRLLRNLGNGTFSDVTDAAGAGGGDYGMGAVAGPDRLLRNDGDGTFSDATTPAGVDSPLWGSSAAFLDSDLDGDLDLYDAQSFRQPSQAFLNDGSGSFSAVPESRIPDLAVPCVGRGTMSLDYDGDGVRDLVITFNNDRARLFRNEIPDRGSWAGFALEGADCNRDGIGARLSAETAGGRQVAERISSSSYQTSSEPRVHLGLGEAAVAERVEVRWPCGRRRAYLALRTGFYYRLQE